MHFYVNVNRLIVEAMIGVGVFMYIHYCKKLGKNPVEPLFK